MEDPKQPDKPIRVVGRYALYGKLAAGGMATVHFGRLLGPAGFSRTVAIKRLHPQFAKDPEFVAMFLDEARLAARIQHPNVVATVDVVAMGDELFLVMDYVRGESFSRLLRASRKKGIDVPVGVVAAVVVGMLHGLHAAHEAKDEQGQPLSVVHRDVSPQNVLVGVDGVSRVLDFGVAKAAARIQVTRDGQMKGKLAYMAPEQLQARGVDRRTDVFASGIVLWEALTGRRLFDAEEASEVLRMILKEDIPPPSAVVPSLTREIDAIVMKALSRDPRLRFQSAREFAIALEEATPIASSREVGEWVERVAGETLLHREQAVAEIEATSAVSETSALSDSAPVLMRTLHDRTPIPMPAPTAAASPGEWDEAPTGVFDPSVRKAMPDGEPTRIHTPRAAEPSAAQRPRRSSAPPRPGKPVSAVGRSIPPRKPGRPATEPASHPAPLSSPTAAAVPHARFDDENETTSVFDPKHHAVAAKAPPSGVAVLPIQQVFDDDNERTKVRDPKELASLQAEKAPPLPPEHVFDDEKETTTVFDSKRPPVMPVKAQAAVRASRPPPAAVVKDAAPAAAKELPLASDVDNLIAEVPGDAARVTQPPKKRVIPAVRPAAGAPPETAPTIIVQDQNTDPSIERRKLLTKQQQEQAPSKGFWDTPFGRVGVTAILVGVAATLAFIAGRARQPPPPRIVEEPPRAVLRPAEPKPAPAPAPEVSAVASAEAAPSAAASSEPALSAEPSATPPEPAPAPVVAKSPPKAAVPSRPKVVAEPLGDVTPRPRPVVAVSAPASARVEVPKVAPPAEVQAPAAAPAASPSPPARPIYEDSLDVDPYAGAKAKALGKTKPAASD